MGCLGMAGRGGGDQREGLPRSRRKFEEVGDMLIILTVVMVSWMYTYARTYQFINFKCEFLYVNYSLIKLLKTNQEDKTDTCKKLNKI